MILFRDGEQNVIAGQEENYEFCVSFRETLI